MKFVLDLSPAVQRRGGIGRYVEELARALIVLPSAGDCCLFWNDRLGRAPAPPLDALPGNTLRWSNKLWRSSVALATLACVPMDGLVGEGDVFHATDHLLPHLRRMRTVFTLHDLVFQTRPETHLRSNSLFLRLMVPVFLRRASAVICVSHHTKAAALRAYRLDSDRLHVIPEGVSSRFSPVPDPRVVAAVRMRYHLPERYILTVGTIEPRKNHITLLRAYEQLRAAADCRHGLVIAGRRGWLAEPFLAALARSPARAGVVLAGEVADDDLPALYSGADLFVYPSRYEGFGLPPLEAMACGTPVVASAATSLPEVVGDAGLLVDPEDSGALAAALRRALEDASLRQALVAKGLARVKLFTWEEAARQTLAVYQEVYQGAHRA